MTSDDYSRRPSAAAAASNSIPSLLAALPPEGHPFAKLNQLVDDKQQREGGAFDVNLFLKETLSNFSLNSVSAAAPPPNDLRRSKLSSKSDALEQAAPLCTSDDASTTAAEETMHQKQLQIPISCQRCGQRTAIVDDSFSLCNECMRVSRPEMQQLEPLNFQNDNHNHRIGNADEHIGIPLYPVQLPYIAQGLGRDELYAAEIEQDTFEEETESQNLLPSNWIHSTPRIVDTADHSSDFETDSVHSASSNRRYPSHHDYVPQYVSHFVPPSSRTSSIKKFTAAARTPSRASLTSQSSLSRPVCRICQLPGEPQNALISPCRCSGTMQYVHKSCLVHWLEISTKKMCPSPRCELCGYQYKTHHCLKVQRLHMPECSHKDKVLHLVFLLMIFVMLGCAALSIIYLQAERDPTTSTARATSLTLEDIIVITCSVLFFLSFFVAVFTQYRADATLCTLMFRCWLVNKHWRIRNYDSRHDVARHLSNKQDKQWIGVDQPGESDV